jgi:hypothetical protein
MFVPVKNLSDIFDCWETIPEMATDVGVHEWNVSKWKQRGSIPRDAWTPVLAALKRKGKKLSADDLLAMHTRVRKSSDARACG